MAKTAAVHVHVPAPHRMCGVPPAKKEEKQRKEKKKERFARLARSRRPFLQGVRELGVRAAPCGRDWTAARW